MLGLLKGIYQLFRYIREFVVSLVFIIFVMTIFAIVALTSNSSSPNDSPLPEQGALRLNLDGYLADNHDEYADVFRLIQTELGEEQPMKISTFDVVRAIGQAKDDPSITGIVLDLRHFEGGDISSLRFIGTELTAFKASKKPVIAIGNYYTQSQYYLASFADKIYLNHAGAVDIHGLNYSTLYFKSLLDKIEAVPHIFRVGTYKSAVEPFLRDEMSDEAKQNAQLWVGRLWEQYKNDVAANRKISANNVLPEAEQFLTQFKNAQGNEALYAEQQGLVTHLASSHEINKMLADTFGSHPELGYNAIDFLDYAMTLPDRFNSNAEHKIAVVNVEGEIALGESDEGVAGSSTIVSSLRKARKDKNVKGVILRVNSPGGSAMASELIRQELEQIQQTGKPVVTSMGGMAASGGYWIAATSDAIIASPSTITGSIGIFGLTVSFEKTAKNLGVQQDGISTSPLANNSPFKTLSTTQAAAFQMSVENGYENFLNLVSKGRKMPKDTVDKVAQGQVWLGEKALELGLVDELGDFGTAYRKTVELIQVKQPALESQKVFTVQWLIDQEQDPLMELVKGFSSQMQINIASLLNLPQPLKQSLTTLGTLTQFNDPKGQYLYCLTCGKID